MDTLTIAYAKQLVDELTIHVRTRVAGGQPVPGPAGLLELLQHAHPQANALFLRAIVESWSERWQPLGLLRGIPHAAPPGVPRRVAPPPPPARPRPVPSAPGVGGQRKKGSVPGLAQILRALDQIRPA
jgi:hypothetical protein